MHPMEMASLKIVGTSFDEGVLAHFESQYLFE
jgi:hypothetical protein